MILIMPLPQMLAATMMRMAAMAIHQLPVQLLMAELASVMPMQMMIGPVTTGGKKRMTRFAPKPRTSADRIRYSRPEAATPTQA